MFSVRKQVLAKSLSVRDARKQFWLQSSWYSRNSRGAMIREHSYLRQNADWRVSESVFQLPARVAWSIVLDNPPFPGMAWTVRYAPSFGRCQFHVLNYRRGKRELEMLTVDSNRCRIYGALFAWRSLSRATMTLKGFCRGLAESFTRWSDSNTSAYAA